MISLDTAAPLVSNTFSATPASGQWLTNGAQVSASAGPKVDNQSVFDVSACDAWTLIVRTRAYGGVTPYLQFVYGDDFATVVNPGGSGIVPQLVQLPGISQKFIGSTDEVMIAGRILGPVLAVLLFAPSGYQVEIDLLVHNRTRLYDAPYTPTPLGTYLATIPNANVAAGANTTVDIPYYLGPAQLTLHAGALTAGRARVLDDLNNVAGSVNANQPTSEIWLPGLIAPASLGATKYQLSATNDAAAINAIGASLIAA